MSVIDEITNTEEIFEPVEQPRLKTFTLAELMEMEFLPIKWIVPDLMPEGLTLLVGAPKLGKSWMAFLLCQAVAFGGYCLNGKKPEQGSVLYLALEDSQRRLQARFNVIAGESERLPYAQGRYNFHFCTEIPRAEEGGLAFLEQFLNENPDCRLVVVDTLQRFRTSAIGGRETYASDYLAMEPLHDLAKKRGIAIVLVHHTRKQDASDPFDKISGTTAIMGACDTIWILERKRQSGDAILSVTGRDVNEHKLAMRFDAVNCHWAVIGDADKLTASKEEQEVLDFALTCNSDGFGPQDLADDLGISRDAAKKRLARMAKAGKLSKLERGKYCHPEKGQSDSRDNKPVSVKTQQLNAFPVERDKGTSFTAMEYEHSFFDTPNICPDVPLPKKDLAGKDSTGDTLIVPTCPNVTLMDDPLVQGAI